MARRNGTHTLTSTVEVRPDGHGSYTVVSVVTTVEYTGCSKDFAAFLAAKLQQGITYPAVTSLEIDGERVEHALDFQPTADDDDAQGGL